MVRMTRSLDALIRFLRRSRARIEAFDALVRVASAAGATRTVPVRVPDEPLWAWEPWRDRADIGSA